MSFSNYTENRIQQHVFQKSTFSAPTTYVGLARSSPLESSTGSNCNEMPDKTGMLSNGYARVATTAATWTIGGATYITNGQEISFPVTSANWTERVRFVLLLDTGVYAQGNLLLFGELMAHRDVYILQRPRFQVNALTINLN